MRAISCLIHVTAATAIVGASLASPGAQSAGQPGGGPPEHPALRSLRWRSIGPANPGGRVTVVAGLPGKPETFYVAGAAGGIFKTTNGGVTFAPVFDDQPVASIGAI